MISITMKCKKHPRYQGKCRPRVECDGCRTVYYLQIAPTTPADCMRMQVGLDKGTIEIARVPTQEKAK